MAGRKIVSVIAVATMLAAFYSAGVFLRVASFTIRGHSSGDLFSMESAQHARHAKMIAEGKAIPRFETHLQYPDGYDTRFDTIMEEYFAGWLYRFPPFSKVPFDVYLHYFVPFLFCIGIFGIYGLARDATHNKLAGLYAAAFYAVAMPAIERSMGDTFYREHLTIPLLIFHLWFMVRAFEYGRWRDYVLAGVVYCMALASWRVMNFYTLVFFGFFAGAYLFNYQREKIIRMLGVIAGCIVAGAYVFNAAVRYDGFLVSPQMFLGYALLAVAAINRYKKLRFWENFGLMVIITGIAFVLQPRNGLYDHAWETIFFQLRYFGQKPADSALLTFDARHLWVPPYVGPSLLRFCNEMLVPSIAAALGISFVVGEIKKRNTPLSLPLLLYLAFIFYAYYLFCFKVVTFVVIFLTVFMGYGMARAAKLSRQWQRLVLAFIFLGGLAFQVYQVYAWDHSVLLRYMASHNVVDRQYTKGVPEWAVKDALSWIVSNTSADEAFVSDISTSPMIAYYAIRPTVLHPYFQTNVIKRFREFSYALFSESEQPLAGFFKKYRARYLLLTARVLLNDDHDMSFRYITDNLALDERWLVYRLHFLPEQLSHFVLVYQNPLIRIYEYYEDAHKSTGIKTLPPPLFNEKLFKLLSFPDTGRYWKNASLCYYYIKRAQGLLLRGRHEEAERLFVSGLRILPVYEGYLGLGKIYALRKEGEKAREAFAIARELSGPEAR